MMTNTKQVGEAVVGGKPTILREIELIVIHCSATRVNRDFTARDVDTAHRYLGYSRWGYHYYIRKSGRIERMTIALRKEFGDRVIGPDKPPVGRIQQLFIRKIILKIELTASISDARGRLHRIREELMKEKEFKSCFVYYDVDPM